MIQNMHRADQAHSGTTDATRSERGIHAAGNRETVRVGGLGIHRKQLTFDYLDTVTGEVLHPAHEPIELPAPAPGVTPERLADTRQALAWFKAEQHVLAAAVTLAVQSGFGVHAREIPRVMMPGSVRCSPSGARAAAGLVDAQTGGGLVFEVDPIYASRGS
jgi:hypothetical protein